MTYYDLVSAETARLWRQKSREHLVNVLAADGPITSLFGVAHIPRDEAQRIIDGMTDKQVDEAMASDLCEECGR